MAEKLLELMEKYEAENREIRKIIDENDLSSAFMSSLISTMNKNNEFIDHLCLMLHSPM